MSLKSDYKRDYASFGDSFEEYKKKRKEKFLHDEYKKEYGFTRKSFDEWRVARMENRIIGYFFLSLFLCVVVFILATYLHN